MSSNPISLKEHNRFVNKLYSLAGPQENLPTVLCMLLQSNEDDIRQKLDGKIEFTSGELIIIQENFKNATLLSA